MEPLSKPDSLPRPSRISPDRWAQHLSWMKVVGEQVRANQQALYRVGFKQ